MPCEADGYALSEVGRASTADMNALGKSPPRAEGPGRRILIISGDVTLREHLYDLLVRHGHVVTTVNSGKIGYDALTHIRPDLILANSASNDCPGWGFADCVRRFDRKLPIIVLGHPGEEPPDPRTASDIQAYLRSDVPDKVLIEAVNRWLSPIQSTDLIQSIDYPGTILAIDDEPGLLRTLEEFLEPRGCRVVTARSGEEGLSQLAQYKPTLVLLDIKMPGMDGLVTLKKIKDAEPRLPVIMASAVEDQKLMQQAFALGAFEYVTKPYDFESLKSVLSYVKQFVERE